MPDLKVLLISTYELGRQPFGLASPAAWLRADGFYTTSLDLSRQSLDEEAVRTANLIAFYLPMHTARGSQCARWRGSGNSTPPLTCADLDCTPRSMQTCCVVWASARSWGESLSRGC